MICPPPLWRACIVPCLVHRRYRLWCELPNARLYAFEGAVVSRDDPRDRRPLTVDNLLLRGSTLRKTDWAVGGAGPRVWGSGFKAAVVSRDDSRDRRPLTVDNLLLRGSTLRKTDWAVGGIGARVWGSGWAVGGAGARVCRIAAVSRDDSRDCLPLTVDNLLLRGSTLRSADYAV